MRWHRVVKNYQGGQKIFQIKIPPKVRISKKDWKTIIEWLGDHTDGGHNYGWRINVIRMKQKNPKLKVVSYPSDILPQLEKYGKEEVTTRKWI